MPNELTEPFNFCLSDLRAEVHCEELLLLLPVPIFSRFGSRSVLHHISAIHSVEHWSLLIQKTCRDMGCKYFYQCLLATAASKTTACFGIWVLLYMFFFFFFFNHIEWDLVPNLKPDLWFHVLRCTSAHQYIKLKGEVMSRKKKNFLEPMWEYEIHDPERPF